MLLDGPRFLDDWSAHDRIGGAERRLARRTSYRVTFAVLGAGVFAYSLLQSLLMPVLTTVQEQFHASQSAATWVLTAYLLSASVCTPIMGRVGDAVGKERVFVAALGMLAVGSLAAALAHDLGVVIAARAVQGVGGGVLPLAFGIIRDEFPEDRITGAVGSIATLTAAGSGVGVVLAGPIVNALGFHWLFWLPLIITVIAAIAAALFIPESPSRTGGGISSLPAVLLCAWLVAILVALSEATQWGWGSAKLIGLLLTAVIVSAAWVRAETRVPTPLIDMRMMRQRAVWTNNLVALLMGIGM